MSKQTSKTVGFKVPLEYVAWLEAVAQAQDRTVSSVVRQIIRAAMASQVQYAPEAGDRAPAAAP